MHRADIPAHSITMAVVEVAYVVTDEGRPHGSEQSVTMHFVPRSEIGTDEKLYTGTAPPFYSSVPDYRQRSPDPER